MKKKNTETRETIVVCVLVHAVLPSEVENKTSNFIDLSVEV